MPTDALPAYDEPPVQEVAFGAAFDAIDKLDSVRVAELWRTLFGKRYPRTRDEGPFRVEMERFGPPVSQPVFSLQPVVGLPPLRVWFLSEDENRLIQLQRDWIARNWRRETGHEPYPRYAKLREEFASDVAQFEEYARTAWDGLTFRQCELTYINHIPVVADDLADLATTLSIVARPSRDLFLPDAEAQQIVSQYVIPGDEGEPLGRLYVTAGTAYSRSESTPITALTLTARGAPPSPDLEGVLSFMDTAHEWIVRGFTTITRPEMHERWRRLSDG